MRKFEKVDTTVNTQAEAKIYELFNQVQSSRYLKVFQYYVIQIYSFTQ